MRFFAKKSTHLPPKHTIAWRMGMTATEDRLSAAGVQPEQMNNEEENEIDILELFYRLLEKIRYIILAGLAVALVVGVVVFNFIRPTYEATSKLYVVNSNNAVVDLSALQIGNYMVADYQEVFSNWQLHQMVIDEMQLPYTYEELNKMVSVSNPSNTRILYIKVTSTDPQEAQAMANCYARISQEFIKATMDSKAPTIFEAALLPEKPAAPHKLRDVVIGFVLGALVAAAVVVIQFLTDDRISSSEYVEKHVGISTLGMMPMEATQQAVIDQKRAPGKRKSLKN